MTLQLDNKGAAKNTADKTVSEQMSPYEESVTFFDNKVTTVKTEGVDVSEKLYVDGLESIINTFGTRRIATPCASVDGQEGFADTMRRILATIVQLAKDAVNFIINLVNNKLTRLENRLHRMRVERKRSGLKTGEVAYPVAVRRLIVPNRVSTNPGWIAEAIDDVSKFYSNAISVTNDLGPLIRTSPDSFDTAKANDAVNSITSMNLNLANEGKDTAGVTTYKSATLPSNRCFIYLGRTGSESETAPMFFQETNADGRLKTPTFSPTGAVIDKTFDAVQGALNDVRKNQRTVSDFHRAFEKSVVAFEGETRSVSTEQRHFLRYLINHTRRLSQVSIQYLIASCDVALDFCSASINK